MKKNAAKDSLKRTRKIRSVLLGTVLIVLLLSSILIAAHIAADKAEQIESNLSTAGAQNPSEMTTIQTIEGTADLTAVSESSESKAVTVTHAATVIPTSSPSATSMPAPTPTAKPTTPTKPPVETTTSTATEHANQNGAAPDLSGYVVVLDPGHQLHANSEQESLGPKMSGTKDKCSSGTMGVSTGRPEYEVNLEIGLKMCAYLQSLGCEVYMTRTTNDVNLSNIDRANIALSHSPDVYIRLHCDGSSNASSRGVGVFVADTGKYAGSLSAWGDLLGGCLSASTGAKYRGCNASSTYSGLNWAADIPSFLLEMGFMSNTQDDELLSDSDYQQKICEGAAEFISQMPKS